MLLYFVVICVAIILILLALEYRKRRNFDAYIKMHLSLDFPATSSSSRYSSRHGFLLFNIKEVGGRYKALIIKGVKIKSKYIRLRTFDTIYTKLPLPAGGVLLSIGVRKSSAATKFNIDSTKIVISGYLLDAGKKKLRFKREVKPYRKQMKKVF